MNSINLDFSIVVCCYLGEKTIVRCLGSLINQNYPHSNYEIIIVDDGSIDNSSDVIINYLNSIKKNKPSIKYYRTENHGLSCARNFGIHFSTGNYILFIDEDAEACNDWLLEYKYSIDKNNSPEIIYGLVKPFYNATNFEQFITYTFYDKLDKKGQQIPVLIGTNMGFKKDIFTSNNGFFDKFNYRGDENIFLLSLNNKYLSIGNLNAYVFHENPKNLLKWLKERFQNGESEYIIDMFSIKFLALEKEKYIFKKLFKKIIVIFLIILLIFSGIKQLYSILIFTLFIFYLVRNEVNVRIKYLKKLNYERLLWNVLKLIIVRSLGLFYKELGYAKTFILNESVSSKKGNYAVDIKKQVIFSK